MKTLLCRRFELALFSGALLSQADPAIRDHAEACERCAELCETDREIASILLERGEPLPSVARQRIETLIATEARDEARRSRRPIPLAWATAAAILLVSTAGAWTYAQSQSAGAMANETGQSAHLASSETGHVDGEPISGLSDLIALHTATPNTQVSTDDDQRAVPTLGRRSALPKGALLYHSKLPSTIGASLGAHEQSAVIYTDVRDEATLFVLDRERIALDPVIDEILTADGSITLSWDGHQVTLAPREGQLFVVVSTPIAAVSAPSYL